MRHALPPRIASLLGDPGCLWSMGAYGAILGLWPDGRVDGSVAFGEGGAMRLRPAPELRVVAFETLSSDPANWNHGLAFCLPACLPEASGFAPGPAGLHHAGPDLTAIRAPDRGKALFDTGLDSPQMRLCLRTDDPALLAVLQSLRGRDISCVLSALKGMRVDWVVRTPLGRMESREAESGPHLVPSLLASGRHHPATTPIPEGFMPFAHAFPCHPLRDRRFAPRPFDPADHAAFQALLEEFGIPSLVRLKAGAVAAMREGAPPPAAPRDRHARTQIRVALRQHLVQRGAAGLRPWLEAFDPALLRHVERTGMIIQ